MTMDERNKALSLLLTAAMLLQGSGADVARPRYGIDQEQGGLVTAEALKEALKEVLNVTFHRRVICPPPYYEVLNECFYIHQFVPLLSWEGARSFCRSMGGDLAQPKHYGALIAYLYENKKLAQVVFDAHSYGLWLGGRVQEGEARWLSGKVIEEMSSRDYSDDQEQQCLIFIIGRHRGQELVTFPCSEEKHFACQLQL